MQIGKRTSPRKYPGCFAALYAMPAEEGLEVFELCYYYRRDADAWEALTTKPKLTRR